MLVRARVNAGSLTIPWPEGDATDFHLARRFAQICSFSNSIQLFGDATRIARFFACVREHLADGGA